MAIPPATPAAVPISKPRTDTDDDLQEEHRDDLKRTRTAFYVVLAIGFGAIACSAVSHGLAAKTWFAAAQAVAGDWLIAIAAFLVGALPGFLFAVPRSVNQDTRTGGAAVAAVARPPLYQPSNNLTDISDWLTKILVGLGLAEISSIKRALLSVSKLASSLLPTPASGAAQAEALAILLAFGVFGFFAGYLWTRLWLSGAFVHAERVFDAARRALAKTPLEFRRNLAANTELSTVAQKAADKLVKKPLASLTRYSDIVAWAKAQASVGRYGKSAEAFQRALDLTPENDALRVERAVVLSAEGRHEAALKELEASTTALDETANPNLRRRRVEGLMFNYLYGAPPEGFRRTIAVGLKALEDAVIAQSAAVWMYLSCAYGQQYKWALEHRDELASTGLTLGEIRQSSYNAAQRALRLDPTLRALMRGFLEGRDGDDDLMPFRDDADFRSLLGA